MQRRERQVGGPDWAGSPPVCASVSQSGQLRSTIYLTDGASSGVGHPVHLQRKEVPIAQRLPLCLPPLHHLPQALHVPLSSMLLGRAAAAATAGSAAGAATTLPLSTCSRMRRYCCCQARCCQARLCFCQLRPPLKPLKGHLHQLALPAVAPLPVPALAVCIVVAHRPAACAALGAVLNLLAAAAASWLHVFSGAHHERAAVPPTQARLHSLVRQLHAALGVEASGIKEAQRHSARRLAALRLALGHPALVALLQQRRLSRV